MEWKKYPEYAPSRSGYFMTYYYNLDECKNYYKAIYWNMEYKQWVPWRRNNSPDLSMIHGFVENSHSDYYTPCVTLFESNPSRFELNDEKDMTNT
jgi:hypothetical protein